MLLGCSAEHSTWALFKAVKCCMNYFCCLSDKWHNPQRTATSWGLQGLPLSSPPSLKCSQEGDTTSPSRRYGYTNADLHLDQNNPVAKQGITNWETPGAHCSQDPDCCTAPCCTHGLTSLSLSPTVFRDSGTSKTQLSSPFSGKKEVFICGFLQ